MLHKAYANLFEAVRVSTFYTIKSICPRSHLTSAPNFSCAYN